MIKTSKTPLRAPVSTGILTGNACQCSECGEIFNSEKGFNKHRRGKYNEERYCLTPEQMREKGMSISNTGKWITEKYIRTDI